MSCQIEVAQGILQGKECTTYYGKKYYSFEGIPYAKPPVGKLRFRDPQELKSWTGVLDATKRGSRCRQINPYFNTPIEGSEDCLYLNVYTPNLPHQKIVQLPVLFFIHGGGLIFGYGDYYKPDYMLKHDIILVTVNYRLNILGFLCLNIPEVPGNAGLKDTIMALRWVNKNIRKFNGDAGNVTVMGESAGGGVSTSYLTSKMADGLYHKVVGESGVSIGDMFVTDAGNIIDKAKLVALNLGKTIKDERSLYEFFVDVPVDDLITAFAAMEMAREYSNVKAHFLPVVEKKFDNVESFFNEHPRTDVALKRFKNVPCLIGMNSHEGALFLSKDAEGNLTYQNDFYHFIPYFMNVKRGEKRVDEIEKKIRQFYFNNRTVGNETKLEYLDLMSDRNLNYDFITMVENLSKSNPNVYFFKFQYSGNMNTRIMKTLGIKGSTHGDVIQYQFYRKAKHDKATKNDIKIVNSLTEMLCNFMKNGTPSWTGQETEWLPYTPLAKHVLIIDDKIKLIKNPDFARFKFWQSITGDSSKL